MSLRAYSIFLSVNLLGNGGGSTIITWYWDFGDSLGTSTDQNPTYSYAAAGNYNVCLRVTDTYGCESRFQLGHWR